MCGFVGCVGNREVLSTARLLAVRDELAHRGPDGAGSWTSEDGGVILGHRRLAIIDLSPSAAQPMLSSSGKTCIVFNGAIYNYQELREELIRQGVSFRSRSDTEVLLAAYEEWGEDCLSRLNGMFAFALWDAERGLLFAARDRFGEKPFYYHVGDDFLLFASETKALLCSGVVSATPNERAVYRYAAFREIDVGEETLIEGIRSLPAAHSLSYSPRTHGLSIRRYWDLDRNASIVLPNDEAYAERFLELLSDAVRIRLRADVPVGSSLSGGLDSSSVVCLVARARKGELQKTFSARFQDPRFDEGRYIEQVTRWTGVPGCAVYPDVKRLPEEMEQLTYHQEEPFFSTSIYAQWCVMRCAKEEGVTVLLDGQGGDETLAGYHIFFGPHFRDFLCHMRWGRLAKQAMTYLREHGGSSLPVILFAMLPTVLRHPVRRRVRPLAIAPDFARMWKREDETFERKYPSHLDDVQYQTLTRTMLPALLRYADRNSMAFSREVRLPFLDHRLVEFLFSIPGEQRLRETTTKFVLRQAMKGVLPEDVRTRKDKLGFAPPQEGWMRGPLKDWIDELLHSSGFRKRGWIDPNQALRVWGAFLGGKDSLGRLVWRWVSLEIWAQLFLDRHRWG